MSCDFGSLKITFDDRVLRPRSWTALQSHWGAELAANPSLDGPLLELCAGAGHIGLLAAALSDRALVAVDIVPDACELTRGNAAAAGLTETVEVRCSPLSSALRLGETFAVAMADPPWVRSDQVQQFPEDPLLAIDGGADGLDLARDCVRACTGHVVPGGSLLLQLGDEAQAERIVTESIGAQWQRGDLRRGAGGVVLQLVAT